MLNSGKSTAAWVVGSVATGWTMTVHSGLGTLVLVLSLVLLIAARPRERWS